MMIPDYSEQQYRSCHQALKLMRALLKGYYVESHDAMQPRMPKWWWLQQNFEMLRMRANLRGTLIILREKRGTRRGKSLYYQTLREKGIYPRERNVPPPTVGHMAGFRAVQATPRPRTGAFGVDPFAIGAAHQQAQAAPQVVQQRNIPPTVAGWNFRVANLDMDGNIIG